MKHVKKGVSPPLFEDWKKSHPQPSYKELSSKECTPIKDSVRFALLQEQGGVCCYCGRAITLDDSHIEHFRPQKIYPKRALDFDNLHFSCIKDQPKTAIYPPHCGHAKGNQWNKVLHISPLDSECEKRFNYDNVNGKLVPRDRADAQAAYMVDLLKLNIAHLCDQRKSAITQVFDADFLETATPQEIEQLRDAFRIPQNFGHVLARFAEQLMEEM